MNTKIFNPKQWLTSPSKPQSSHTTNLDEIETITQRIEHKQVDIAPTYAQWRDLGFALSSEPGESGRAYYHRLSSFYPNYSQQETDDQYDRCLRSHGTGITIKTFYQMAKDSNVSISTKQTAQTIKSSQLSKSSPDNIDNTDKMITTHTEENLPTFSNKVAPQLPQILQKIVEVADNEKDADILILGALTAFSSCLTKIEGIYDKRIVYPNLFTFITARASSGKGRLTLCRNLIDPVHNQLRNLNIAEREEYKNKMNEYNAAKNKKSLQKPEEPPLRMLLIPANSSATAVYQTLNENNGIGLIFETEGDTLANTFNSDYGNYSDGFRKAFHHEAISYIRRKDKEYVSIANPCLSTLLTGTPQQVRTLIKDAENGLFSRFLFYYLNAKTEWHNVFSSTGNIALDDHFRALGEEFYSLYQLLQPMKAVRVEMTPSQQSKFNNYFSSVQTSQMNTHGEYIIASVRRLGLSAFRIILILSALRILETGEIPTKLTCTDEDFTTALTICSTLMVHTGKIFSTLPQVEENSMVQVSSSRQQQFLNALPENATFTRQIYLQAAETLGVPVPSADRYINRWVSSGVIVKIGHGEFRRG